MKFYELETEFSFGKYEGKSLQEILEIQPSYIQWCIDNLDHFYISDQVIQKIKSIKPDFRLNQDSLDRLKEKKDFIKLSDTRPFVWSKLVYLANKTIFNYAPVENDFESEFARFLNRAEDVVTFCKVVPKIGFFVEYRDSEGNLRLYYPDFLIVLNNGERLVIETKGIEDVDVKHKDKRAELWCEDASRLTGEVWRYCRVDQEDFEKYKYKTVSELVDSIR